MNFVRAREQDSLQIAQLHKEFIPTGFLSQQSLSFLNALYLFLIRYEIVYAVKEDGKTVGFIAGSLHTGRLYKRFLKNNLPLLIKFTLINLFSIDFLKKVTETLNAPKKTTIDEIDIDLPELLSIVVDGKHERKGYGKQLLDCLEQELRKGNSEEYKVVVGSQLEANRFYMNNSFEKNKEIELHKGAVSYLYIKKL